MNDPRNGVPRPNTIPDSICLSYFDRETTTYLFLHAYVDDPDYEMLHAKVAQLQTPGRPLPPFPQPRKKTTKSELRARISYLHKLLSDMAFRYSVEGESSSDPRFAIARGVVSPATKGE